MRDKIGRYHHRLMSNIHTRYMDKKYEWNWPENQTKFEDFLEKLEDFIQTLYVPINYFLDKRKSQVVKVRIDPWDTWSMDHTLAEIILPMLIQLKESRNRGAPLAIDPNDVPEDLRPDEIKSDDENLLSAWESHNEKHFAAWDWILDEMIWAFEKKCSTDYGLFDNMSDDEYKNHHERMKNAFLLFGKYYEDLWT